MKEPILHTYIEDKLPEDHPLGHDTIYCTNCKLMLHAFHNECMQTWLETEVGNYCVNCLPITCIMDVEMFDNLKQEKK